MMESGGTGSSSELLVEGSAIEPPSRGICPHGVLRSIPMLEARVQVKYLITSCILLGAFAT